MALPRLVPRRFRTRLILMVCFAGFVPVLVFVATLRVHEARLRSEALIAIQHERHSEWKRTELLLRDMAEDTIRHAADAAAEQLDIYIAAHPKATLEELCRSPVFRSIAVQPVGRTGYTAVHESDTATNRVHRNPQLEGRCLRDLSSRLPEFWAIIDASLHGKRSDGYYDWKDADGAIRPKFMCVVPVETRTADGIALSVAATTYVDEFSAPILSVGAVARNATNDLTAIVDLQMRSYRNRALTFTALGLLVVFVLAYIVGGYLSRTITGLRRATASVNAGDFMVEVPTHDSGEMGELTRDFNRMIRALADTMVSKKRLEDGERVLKATNAELRREVSQRRRAQRDLKRRVEFEQLVSALSTRFISCPSDSIDLGIDAALEAIGEFAGVDRSYLFTLRDDGETLDNTHEWCAEGVKPQTHRFQGLILRNSFPWIARQITQNETVCVNRIADLPPDAEAERAEFETEGIRSMVVVPMASVDGLAGFVGFDSVAREQQWSDDTIALLRLAGEMFANALARKRAEEAMRASERALRVVVDSVCDAIFIHSVDGTIVDVNEQMLRMYGVTAEEARTMSIAEDFSSRSNPLDSLPTIWQQVLEGHPQFFPWKARRPHDGHEFHVEVFLRKIPYRNSEAIIANVRDVTERKRSEEKLDRLAHHDALTSLPNRLLFSDRLSQRIAQARRDDSSLAVMFLDLDRFKVINDSLGHNAGDDLLQQVAGRLKNSVRESDTVARMGGDEFTILIAGLQARRDAERVAEHILECMADPFTVDSRELFVSTSIGISIYPSDGHDVETMVRNADAAMYRAKDQGRNNYQFYTEALNTALMERMTLEQSLRRALEKDELLLHYQPRVDIRTGEILGAEALIRWQHPDMGLVSPAQFIPLAEETGLIVPISAWVLQAACRQARVWQDAGLPPVCISVNVSTSEFRRADLPGSVAEVLRESGIAPSCLEIEMTESTVMHDPDQAAQVLGALKGMGVRISIDDFGTGYSSLSYLTKLPIDAVKIDSSFVRDVTDNPDDAAIAGAVVAMAHSLDLSVVAEGVETLEQLDFLRSLNCDEVQGYFVARPCSADDFRCLLSQRDLLSDVRRAA